MRAQQRQTDEGQGHHLGGRVEPSGSVELIYEGPGDLPLQRRLERLRLVEVGIDGIRAARARTLEERVRGMLPHEGESGPLSASEGLALLELGTGMRLAELGWQAKLRLAQELGR